VYVCACACVLAGVFSSMRNQQRSVTNAHRLYNLNDAGNSIIEKKLPRNDECKFGRTMIVHCSCVLSPTLTGVFSVGIYSASYILGSLDARADGNHGNGGFCRIRVQEASRKRIKKEKKTKKWQNKKKMEKESSSPKIPSPGS
jgi:hypothetical protein